MKIKFLVLGLLFCCVAVAQEFGDTSSFVLKGHITNFKAHYFEYGLTGLFDNTSSSVMVDDDGNFSKSIAIENNQQDIYLYLHNDAIALSVIKNDTINLSWDANQFQNSFKIFTQNKERENALNVQWAQYLNFRKPYINLYKKLYEDKTLNDSAKFSLVNNLFNRELELLTDSCRYASFNNLYPDLYFKYINLLWHQYPSLIPKYNLVTDTFVTKSYADINRTIPRVKFTMLDEKIFWTSVEYREFLYNYPRFEHLFRSFSGKMTDDFNPTLENYYLAKAVMKITPIRNWFITKNILSDYGHYNIENVFAVSEMFQKELTDAYLKQLLSDKYTAMITLKKGQPAPAFTLKNEHRQNVSLSDFKGKVVYIDFWGVGCGPCIYDIEHYEKGLHEKYKEKNVVFISICVDSNEQDWKAGMQKHSMNNEGVNLIAEGWTKNPVCKAYNVSGIPHYILIDKEGKIADNNAPRMGEIMQQKDSNVIDKLLFQ